jgi:RNA polymerase sigma-70 factor (ECF subfamily)
MKMNDLKPKSRALFRRARADFQLREADRARLERAFVASIGLGGATVAKAAHAVAVRSLSTSALPAGALPAAATGAGSSSVLVAGAAKWVSIVLLVGGVGAAYEVRRGHDPSVQPRSSLAATPSYPAPHGATEHGQESRRTPPSPIDTPPVGATARAAPTETDPLGTARGTPPLRRPELRPREPAIPEGPAGGLAEETLRLRAADEALRSGDADRALSLLDEHSRSYPASVLSEERSADRVSALCKLGRLAEAQDEAERFLASTPDSLLADRVRSSCGVVGRAR